MKETDKVDFNKFKDNYKYRYGVQVYKKEHRIPFELNFYTNNHDLRVLTLTAFRKGSVLLYITPERTLIKIRKRNFINKIKHAWYQELRRIRKLKKKKSLRKMNE